MSTQTMIERIVEARKPVAEQMEAIAADWEERKKKSFALKRSLSDLSRIVSRQSMVGDEPDDAFLKMAEFLHEAANDGVVPKLDAMTNNSFEIVRKLRQRFCRSTVNLAAVGTGRCGKSTALKTLIGLDLTDNSVIPSGDGPAVTAGKSEIHCIGPEEKEYAEIDFHTADSFLATIVNAPLDAMGMKYWECATLDDFASIDFAEVKKELDSAKADADAKVREIEMATDFGDKAKALDDARREASAYFRHQARLHTLCDIQNAFRFFRDKLTGGTSTIELEEVGRFVSYPRNGSSVAMCFAIRACRIYAHFPNPEAQGLVLTDLPGLGTMSDMEEKCFLEGMNYSLDTALVIRRPEALFANYPTEEDARVRNSLGAIYGPARLPAFTVFFQNDGNIAGSGVENAFSELQKNVAAGTTILRGDASDRKYMQEVLLPTVLEFVQTNVPKLDKALLDEAQNPLDSAAKEFDELYDRTIRKLNDMRHLFPAGGGASEIVGLVEKVRLSWTRDLVALQKDLSSSEAGQKDIALQSQAITELVEEARNMVMSDFAVSDERRVGDLSVRIQQDHSVIPYVNRSLHDLRIRISEVFSKLQQVHNSLVADMGEKAALLLFAPLGALRPATPTLAAFADILEKSGEAPGLKDAVENLNSVEIPFYTIVYPDLRKEVFAQFEREQGRFAAIDSMPEDERAAPTLQMLCNLGTQWISRAETLLRGQNRVREILAAAVERFSDRVVRSDGTQRELIVFLEQNLDSVHPTDEAGKAAIRAILEKVAS